MKVLQRSTREKGRRSGDVHEEGNGLAEGQETKRCNDGYTGSPVSDL